MKKHKFERGLIQVSAPKGLVEVVHQVCEKYELQVSEVGRMLFRQWLERYPEGRIYLTKEEPRRQ